ncbi:MAG: tRNA (5-methylaminomethyl-2-thiouridine)(34)-methyltransferase MnmD [Roseobacter sp.]
MQNQTADVTWRQGEIPVSTRFDDPYFSLENGLAETQHVFLQGNDLPNRFCDGFHVAELGFGTGLNALATLKAWEKNGCAGQLKITSFEAFPLAHSDMAKALSAFDNAGLSTTNLLSEWRPEGGEFSLSSTVTLEVVVGDANETLRKWSGHADAWFLDGFSPAKNPELWTEELMQCVGQHTAFGGTFATYTAAGFVRRALEDAGFDVERRPGFGRKRHMTVGILRL